MSIDVGELINDIISEANDILDADISELRGFSKRQVKALATQAKLTTKAILEDDISDDLRDFFFQSLEDMALNFVRTIAGILLLTIEKVWNAIVGVIFRAINSVLDTEFVVLSPSRGF